MAKVLEIEFKGGRKAFFANPQEFPFIVGDKVIVQVEKGEDLGMVINMGSLVDQRAGDQTLPQVIRKPGKQDLAKKEENSRLEEEAFQDCLKRIEEHGLDMKLVDVEYQFDRNKTTFYFTSENRVDFRALVRDLARKYHTRIELRQIGVRDEAKRIGGVGVCGRSLCCTTFLREFEPVVTQLAKDQNLALNPTKLSGCCGRLMCCLRYEEKFYSQMLKQFPAPETKIRTDKGTGRLKKIDIFHECGTVRYESGEEETFGLEKLQEFLNRKPERKPDRKPEKNKPDRNKNEQKKTRDNRKNGRNHQPDNAGAPASSKKEAQDDGQPKPSSNKQKRRRQDKRNRGKNQHKKSGRQQKQPAGDTKGRDRNNNEQKTNSRH